MLHNIELLIKLMQILKPAPTESLKNAHPSVLAVGYYSKDLIDLIGDRIPYITSLHMYLYNLVADEPAFFQSSDMRLFNSLYQSKVLSLFSRLEDYMVIDEVYQSWYQDQIQKQDKKTRP